MTIKPYSIIEFDQGTQAWLEWRNQGIGASDAPVVMDENPWKKIGKLLQEKCNPPVDGFKSQAMIRGVRLEPEARAAYNKQTGHEVNPLCIQSKDNKWMRASLDGISADGTSVVEIKCGESVYQKTATSKKVPRYYYGQLQHILAVTGLPAIDFWCYLPGKPNVMVKVARDNDYIEELISKESEFWELVQQNRK